MLRLERYDIDQSPERLIIRLEQRTNALVNMAIAAGIILVSAWLLFTSTDPAGFYYVLVGVGALWLVGAILGFRAETRYLLTREGVVYAASGRSETISISASDLSHVSLERIVRPTGRQRAKVIFRWHVLLIDRQGSTFKEGFRLQREDNARMLASIIGEFYGIEVSQQASGA